MPRTVEEPPPRRPAYFWWLLANALALCFAIISWAVCLHVFGNPELPRNYEILGKLGRLPVLKAYSQMEVPNGNAMGPKELYKRYFGYTEDVRVKANSLLLRNYMTNFDRSVLLTYAEGEYVVKEVRTLGSGDFFDPGIAVRAQAMVKPDDFTKAMPYPVFIDYLVSTEETGASTSLKPGDLFTLKKSPACAAVIHVSRTISEEEPALLLTVVPIASGLHQIGDSEPFKVLPPLKLRPGSGFPAFKD
ncbi:MAG: hypothetical protein EOP88_12810 [Verrucomicrobiaceae bacterium]|nr:MAG: hypothetical protein EOP88_12810 [Verrucomicrobiaceae bacterium]